MPELPEIAILAGQMRRELIGKKIKAIEVLQPKCLNVPKKKFMEALTGAQLQAVTQRGKWLCVETTRGWLLLCLGMGGEVLLVNRASLPDKRRLIFDFTDRTCLAVNFWWFGYAHYAPADRLARHAMTARLGPNALDLSAADLRTLLAGKRGQIKAFLLDQARLAGIGNFYVHDILFCARLHPQRAIASLTPTEIERLAQAIHTRLKLSLAKRGAAYEVDLYGRKGRFSLDDVLVGYKENRPCPVCRTSIKKIRTGSTSSFICPQCQPLRRPTGVSRRGSP